MRRTPGSFAWIASVATALLLFIAGLLGIAPPAQAQQLERSVQPQQIYGDLDHDGIRDVVTHAGSWDASVKISLSTKRSPRTIRTKQPLVWINVADINGDGRLDLIAADKSTRVHIWEYRGGKLRPVRSPPVRPRVRPGSNRIADKPASEQSSLPDSGPDASPCDMSSVAWLSQSRDEVVIATDIACPPAQPYASLPPSRAPPQ